ncbi:sulfate transporter 3,4 [Artemisia annua]|uniref:Sulfate transporter 3,4 n=1 Tax=Artemisia annua TaxID=35608 RepID=A0A2U1L9B7_ARTAN|nr:sulfate transporter 3,4 [Artemisia annua]
MGRLCLCVTADDGLTASVSLVGGAYLIGVIRGRVGLIGPDWRFIVGVIRRLCVFDVWSPICLSSGWACNRGRFTHLKDFFTWTRPNTSVLGNIPSTQIYQNLFRNREAQRGPLFVILGVEAPIYFANSTYLQERILRWLREEEDWVAANNIWEYTKVYTKGLAMVNELRTMLEKRSFQEASVMEKLHQLNTLDSFGPNGLYLTVGEAVSDISSSWKGQP